MNKLIMILALVLIAPTYSYSQTIVPNVIEQQEPATGPILDKLVEKIEKRTENIEKSVLGVKDRIAEILNSIKEAREDRAGLFKEILIAKEERKTIIEGINELRLERGKILDAIAELKAERTSIVESIQAFRADLAEMRAERKTILESLAEIRTERATIIGGLNSLGANLRESMAKNQEARAEFRAKLTENLAATQKWLGEWTPLKNLVDRLTSVVWAIGWFLLAVVVVFAIFAAILGFLYKKVKSILPIPTL